MNSNAKCIAAFLSGVAFLYGIVLDALSIHASVTYSANATGEAGCLLHNPNIITWLFWSGVIDLSLLVFTRALSIFIFLGVCVGHKNYNCLACVAYGYTLVAVIIVIGVIVFYIAMPVLGSVALSVVYPLCTETYDRYYTTISIVVVVFQFLRLLFCCCQATSESTNEETQPLYTPHDVV